MAMAYATAGFCFFLTFLNLISLELVRIRARPRPAPSAAGRRHPKVRSKSRSGSKTVSKAWCGAYRHHHRTSPSAKVPGFGKASITLI